ncbi:hypothetical protein L3X38_003661 [Prunus dulcis]|uniref:Reverse transcriptase Ty1/copia-type domain-containing protein n=1 Tax=Prunus dulcis TaxID=3755 RepID=A0AAD4ZMH4_PRUDU|nr:hypothetical protein L3X38_003661 [Prunus dulcis]
MVHGLPHLEEHSGVCEGCQYGKQHRDEFPKDQAMRANAPLELIHVDLCDPMRNESIVGNKYFMLLIDDFTTMTWVYFLRCPTKSLNNITPFEAYSGRKPGIAHLSIFGSLCYVLVPSELRRKLEPKSVKGVFVGYATCEKGYRIFDPISKKLFLSRDIIFDNEGSWHWKENSEQYVASLNGEGQSNGSLRIEGGEKKYAKVAQDESWLKAVQDELFMIEKNDTWELVDRPFEKPVIRVNWVYKTKLNLNGSVQKNKASLVVKGYAQKPRVDYDETYALVARLDIIKTLIALAA